MDRGTSGAARASKELAENISHGLDDRQRAAILANKNFATISEEQKRAFQHATGPEGLAIIDGQAGTGKSYTISAIRQAYEAAGYRVGGFGPTNKVAEAMSDDGFDPAKTVHSELFALNNARTSWNKKTVVIVDEAAMIDTKLMAMITAHAHDAAAKLILVGDDRQLSSIDFGGMFAVLKNRHGAAELSEVRRQNKPDFHRASEMMAEGNFEGALHIYEKAGAIHWTRTQPQARDALVKQWAKDNAENPDKNRFVFAYTNDDVATLNAALRSVRKARGELGEDHAIGKRQLAVNDRIQFTDTDKRQGIVNGTVGTIEAIDGTHLAVRLDGRKPKTINFDPANFDQFRHGYAGTIYRGQGCTLDETYLYHSEHWRSSASYVALTRHSEKAEIFVATNTLNPPRQTEPWMSEKGGAAALSEENFESAQRSYEKWRQTNPAAAAHHGFADYVQFVQNIWAKKQPETQEPENTRSSLISTLARQMGRTEEQRAASNFHTLEQFAPVPPLTAAEILAQFGGEIIRPRDPASNADSQYQAPRQSAKPAPDEPVDKHTAEDEPVSAANDHDKPFTEQSIYRDPWSAVYRPIPADADRTLLQLAHIASGKCRDAVSPDHDLPGPQDFAPTDLGKDASEVDNLRLAAERLAELETRLHQTPQQDQANKDVPLPPKRERHGFFAGASAFFADAEKVVSAIFHGLSEIISPSSAPDMQDDRRRAQAALEQAQKAAAEQRQKAAEAAERERVHAEQDAANRAYWQSLTAGEEEHSEQSRTHKQTQHTDQEENKQTPEQPEHNEPTADEEHAIHHRQGIRRSR